MGGGGDSCAPIFGSNEPNFCTAESHTVEYTNLMAVCIFQQRPCEIRKYTAPAQKVI